MALIDACSSLCTKSELELFEIPSTQASIEETRVEEFHPLTSLDKTGPVEFKVAVGEGEMIDLSDTFLYLRVKIQDENGANLPAVTSGTDPTIPDKSKVFPINCFPSSLFKDIETTLNNKLVGSKSGLYPYRGYMETLLSYEPSVKQNQLRACMYYEDKPGDMNRTDPTEATTYKDVKKRWNLTKFSRQFECIGKIHTEMFEQNKLLLNKVTVGVKLTRNDPKFVLMAKEANENYRISIDRAILLVTVKRVAAHVREALEMRLLNTKAKYPIRRTEIRFFSKGAGNSDLSEANVISGVLPSRIIFGLVETDAFNGHYQKNPFNFKDFGLSEITVKKNGSSVPFQPMSVDFTNNKESLMSYMGLMRSLGLWNKTNRTNGLNPITAHTDGFSLFGVNLNQDFSSGGGHFNVIQTGVIQLVLKLKQASTTGITIICYMEWDGLVEIDKDRNITVE